MATELLPWQGWPELVFHVLAHVEQTAALPASAFDASYCAFVEQHVGPCVQRPLGEDAALLGRALSGHGQLARLQLLAWLFEDAEHALAVAQRDLTELTGEQVARPRLLSQLPLADPLLEALRCAALLECEVMDQLPPVSCDAAVVGGALAQLSQVAPRLRDLRWRPLRALGWRGRVAFGEIWTGVPAGWSGAPTVAHVAWQAAHEATVIELAERYPQMAELATEQLAVLLLHRRAGTLGLEPAHADWSRALHPSVAAALERGPDMEQRAMLEAAG